MIYIVANKTAGHGVAAKVLNKVCAHLSEKKRDIKVLETRSPLHATELAQQAVLEGAECVFALGGDGTVREVAEGIMRTDIPMGIIPAGTGNDIAKAVELPSDPIEALNACLERPIRKLDMGVINDMSFLNVVGTGFDVETLQWTLKFKRTMRGIIPYLLGVICSIAKHRDVGVKLTIDGVERRLSALMVTVANGVCFGGGMKVAPDAKPDDGLFELLIIHPVARWKIPFLLPKFVSGKIKTLKYVETMQCREVIIEGENQVMDIDGELVPMDIARIKMVEGALLVKA